MLHLESSTSRWLVHSSWIASTISLSLTHLHIVDELIVKEGLSLLSINTSSGRSATTVATNMAWTPNVFACSKSHDDHHKNQRSLRNEYLTD